MATEYDAALWVDVTAPPPLPDRNFKDAMQRALVEISSALDETNARAPRTPDTLRERLYRLVHRRWPQATQERHYAEGMARAQVFQTALHLARKRLSL